MGKTSSRYRMIISTSAFSGLYMGNEVYKPQSHHMESGVGGDWFRIGIMVDSEGLDLSGMPVVSDNVEDGAFLMRLLALYFASAVLRSSEAS